MTTNSIRRIILLNLLFACLGGPLGSTLVLAQAIDAAPRSLDSRVIIEPFAAAPQIVHPIGATCDARGRLLVIESHTHFPPDDYMGPGFDRVKAFEDTDADGRADRISVFFEGTRKTMDIASHTDGSIFLASRNEIIRLRDTDGDGTADERKQIVSLDTASDYPHNGLSGLAFDAAGNLYFGLGENLGAPYTLTGSDGSAISDEGEGGDVFLCTSDGQNLRRVATGFWNPFGVCVDVFGRVFAVDNDPDAMPPCRLLHVVEGGNYGYQFRYGRTGRHPFQAWNGHLPGTLPMVAGTGEAPCEIIAYEAAGLPAEYRGNLLVASWADHRLERYVLAARGASLIAERKPFIQGGDNFRPVGIAVAPDGSLYITDWVLRDYKLHGKGAIWHVKLKEADAATPTVAELAESEARTRAAELSKRIVAGDRQLDLNKIAEEDPSAAVRAMAVREMVARSENVTDVALSRNPAAVRAEAIAGLAGSNDEQEFLMLLDDADPFIRTAAIAALARSPKILTPLTNKPPKNVNARLGVLLACQILGESSAEQALNWAVTDNNLLVRFMAAKWIADDRMERYREPLAKALADPKLDTDLVFAYTTALARIDGQAATDSQIADQFAARLADPQNAANTLRIALKLVPPNHEKLSLDVLTRLLKYDDAGVQTEAIRTLCDHPNAGRISLLLAIITDEQIALPLRAQALAGLASASDEGRPVKQTLLELAQGSELMLRDEALRSLVGRELSSDERDLLERLAKNETAVQPLVARVLGGAPAVDRPPVGDISAWLARLEGPADAEAGRRVFFHARVGGCARCHRHGGRGFEVGPDLSTIGRANRQAIVESIVRPSAQVAPRFQSWAIATDDGLTRTGFLVRQTHDELTYIDAKGEPFVVNSKDVVAEKALATSVMPENIAETLTDQELRDLLAYLLAPQ
jgi:putative membrane-bound dehydrogenase-like protein